MSRIDEIRKGAERLRVENERDLILAATDVGRAYENTIRDLLSDIDYLLSRLKDGGAEDDLKASYSVAHEARYSLKHAVHPDVVVLWFLAMKSHWFDDPSNMFFGMREQAKAYLY